MDSDQRYWLEDKWKWTSKVILKVLRKHVLTLYPHLRDGDNLDGNNWNKFVGSVQLDIDRRWTTAERRRPTIIDKESFFYLYDVARTLVGDLQPIRRELLSARRRIDPRDPGGVLYSACEDGLISARHIAIGGTLHAGKLWARLDSMSRSIYEKQRAQAGGEVPFSRRDDRHINVLFEHIKGLRAAKLAMGREEKNLPRNIETVWDYFTRFYRDEYLEFVEGLPPDPTTIGGAPFSDVVGYQEMRVKARILLGRLPSEELRTVTLLAFNFPESDFLDKDEYCRTTGISCDRFDELHAEALSHMAAGLQGMEWNDQ